ncbi:MAG: polynucleotide adenylyltransferase PcnB [Alkalispirochaetaceae bacterium]
MRKRYFTTEDGTTRKQADIYTRDEHGINLKDLDPDAVKVTSRLERFDHEAYVVGGAVRDLLVGKQPKDFDIATDATPNRLRKLFRNSRVIGKRFRIVHILFRDKVIEVTTFRAQDSEGFRNVYGTIQEDVLRRDFSLNALYYSPVREEVVDFVGGVKDIQRKLLRPIIPLERIFEEDPVRMVRAIKYSVATGFQMQFRLRRKLRRSVSLLGEISDSRLTEEVFKILHSGYAAPIFEKCLDYQLLHYLLPSVSELLSRKDKREFRERFFKRLEDLDEVMRESAGEAGREVSIAYLGVDYLLTESVYAGVRRIPIREAYFVLKEFLRPVTPANRSVEDALSLIFRRKRRFEKEGVFEVKPKNQPQ